MYVDDLIWLPNVVEKLARKHNVRPEEVEEVFLNRPRFRFHERGKVQGENLYVALGRTDGGRYLIVHFIFKSRSRGLVISARDMDKAERRYYGRK